MARRVILHVGLMKSATTTIQQTCNANRDELRERGVLWLPSRIYHQAILDLTAPKRLHPSYVGAWQRMSQKVTRHRGLVLISCERLAALPPPKIRKVMDELGAGQARVVVTARDLARVVPSHWQERVKNKGTQAWDDWLSAICEGPLEAVPGTRFWGQQDLPRILRTWGSAAPGSEIAIVTVPFDQSDPDLLWRRFTDATGLPLEGIAMTRSANPSLGATSAELLRRVNASAGSLPMRRYRHGFKRPLAHRVLVPQAKDEPKLQLSDKAYARIRELAIDMADELEAMDVSVVGDLADLVPPERPEQHPSGPTEGQLLSTAISALDGLGRQVALQHEELRRHRKARRMAMARAARAERQAARISQRAASSSQPSPPAKRVPPIRRARSLLSRVRRRTRRALRSLWS